MFLVDKLALNKGVEIDLLMAEVGVAGVGVVGVEDGELLGVVEGKYCEVLIGRVGDGRGCTDVVGNGSCRVLDGWGSTDVVGSGVLEEGEAEGSGSSGVLEL